MNSRELLALLDKEINAEVYERHQKMQESTIEWLEKGGFFDHKAGKPPIVLYGNDLTVAIHTSEEAGAYTLHLERGGKHARWDFPGVEDKTTLRYYIRLAMYRALCKLDEITPTYR